MDSSSFLTSLGTYFLIFVALMLLFTWLSSKPGNAVVYYPKRIPKDQDPGDGGSKTRNPFEWINEVLSTTEQEVISLSGLDTAVYFVFLRIVLRILALSGVVLLPVLLPVAATARNGKFASTKISSANLTEFEKLSMGNIEDNSSRLWAFLVATYWVSFVTYYLLWKAYEHVNQLRADALMSSKDKPEQFAILVRDIPPAPEGQTRNEQIDSYFNTTYPETFYRSMVLTDNKEVTEIWEEEQGYKKRLARAEAIYAQSKTSGKPKGTRPTHRTGFLGLFGEKEDSIEYYNEKIKEVKQKLKSEQKVTLKEKQLDAVLVFFRSRVTAASAAQSLHAQVGNKWTVMGAPEPRQLIWNNLKIKYFEREVRKFVVYVIVGLTILFYMIPMGFISGFTTLEKLMNFLPFLKPVVEVKIIRTLLEAFLPQIPLIIFLALLPKWLLFLSKAEGIISESQAVRAASGKYFYFTVLNVFIGVSVGESFFSTLKDIQNHPNSIVSVLANSLPADATFFLTYVALEFFVSYGLELSRLIPLTKYHLKRKYWCKMKAELEEAWRPKDIRYGTRVPCDMLIFTIVLCYSIMAPLIIPFGAVYFGLGWVTFKNQALQVYVPYDESYGQMWPHIHTWILASLTLFQVTMSGYFGVKKFYYDPLLIPLPILSLLFGYACRRKFYRFFHDTALQVASHDLLENSKMNLVCGSFNPPNLKLEKTDDDLLEEGLTGGSNIRSFDTSIDGNKEDDGVANPKSYEIEDVMNP